MMKSRINEFTDKKILLVVPGGIDYPVYQYIATIIELSKLGGSKICLLDVFDIESTARTVNKKLSHNKFKQNFRNQIFQIFLDDYLETLVIQKLVGNNYLLRKPKVSFFGFLKDIQYFRKQEYFSTRSALATKFTCTWRSNYRVLFLRRRIRNYLVDFRSSYTLTVKYISEFDANLVVFFNGRHPSQAGVRAAVEERGIDFLTVENGFPPNTGHFHLEKFQIQETLKLQERFLEDRASWSKEEHLRSIQVAENWLIEQSSNRIQNPFILESKISERFQDLLSEDKLAVIFTSSVDETINNLGHTLNNWDSQGHAIVESSKYLRGLGYRTVVRIHPNSMNKSYMDLTDLVRIFVGHGIEFIFPWDNCNSYDLVSHAKLVGTWDSRIGIEAASRGIPTFVLGVSEYDVMADIPRIGPTHLNLLSSLDTYSFDRDKILASVYQMHNHGVSIDRNPNSDLVQRIQMKIASDYASLKNRRKRALLIYRMKHILHFLFFFIPRGRFLSPRDIHGFARLFLGRDLAFAAMQRLTLMLVKNTKSDFSPM